MDIKSIVKNILSENNNLLSKLFITTSTTQDLTDWDNSFSETWRIYDPNDVEVGFITERSTVMGGGDYFIQIYKEEKNLWSYKDLIKYLKSLPYEFIGIELLDD